MFKSIKYGLIFIIAAAGPVQNSIATENPYKVHLRLQVPLTSLAFSQPGDDHSPFSAYHTPLSIGITESHRWGLEASIPIPIYGGYHALGTINRTFIESPKLDFIGRVGGGYFKEARLESEPIWTGPTVVVNLGLRWKFSKYFSLYNQVGLMTLFGTFSNTGLSYNDRHDTKFLPTVNALGVEFRF